MPVAWANRPLNSIITSVATAPRIANNKRATTNTLRALFAWPRAW